ncbi:hypothetical protein BvCmsF30A_04966 [Escherichia coli]|nr:hypothetical protein BvCmsF30A_04966 [Escherichia coli]
MNSQFLFFHENPRQKSLTQKKNRGHPEKQNNLPNDFPLWMGT